MFKVGDVIKYCGNIYEVHYVSYDVFGYFKLSGIVENRYPKYDYTFGLVTKKEKHSFLLSKYKNIID